MQIIHGKKKNKSECDFIGLKIKSWITNAKKAGKNVPNE